MLLACLPLLLGGRRAELLVLALFDDVQQSMISESMRMEKKQEGILMLLQGLFLRDQRQILSPVMRSYSESPRKRVSVLYVIDDAFSESLRKRSRHRCTVPICKPSSFLSMPTLNVLSCTAHKLLSVRPGPGTLIHKVNLQISRRNSDLSRSR